VIIIRKISNHPWDGP